MPVEFSTCCSTRSRKSAALFSASRSVSLHTLAMT
jgi:hypothetical protein